MANIETVGDANHDGLRPTGYSQKNIARGSFSSPEAFVRWLNGPEALAAKWADTGRKDDCDPEFYGTDTFREACDMALSGWKEGAEQAAKLRDRINAENPRGNRLVRYDVAGMLPHVPRYVAGSPMHMKRMDNAKLRRKPVVTLVSHYGALSEVDARHMARRAAVVAAVVDAVEAAGFSCQVIAYTVSTDWENKTVAETSVTLKEAGDPMDMGRLAFGLGNPAMLRRLTFAFRGSIATAKPLTSGMGATIYDDKLKTDVDAQVYLIPAIQNLDPDGERFKDDSGAATGGLQSVIGALRRQGCPAFPKEEEA